VIKAKLRNVKSGSIFEQSFRSGDKYRSVRIDKGEASYLYGDGDFYHFLDSDTYEEVVLGRDLVADLLPLMKEGATVSLLRYQDTLIGIELPITVELAVADTDPGLRGDTVSGATKPARLETGATVQVPLFVGVGDVIRVDTRTGNYMERV
jgi:elongation factor P